MRLPIASLIFILLPLVVHGLDSFPPAGMAATNHELVIPIEVQTTSASPGSMTFKIDKTTYALDVYRKTPEATSWGAKLTTIAAGSATWTDSTAVIGTAYEYRFHAQNVPSVEWIDEGFTMATGHNLYANTHVLAWSNVDRTGTISVAYGNNPGDGRFDQSHFRNSVNGGCEIGALRDYLNKLHDYKHAQNGFKPGRRSIMMDGGSLFPPDYALE